MLQQFLDNKPLYYDEIDYTRMPRVYEKIKTDLPKVKIIHLVGTNGKGTTGRFLACALYARGYSVGHYTSPHIVEFNERIWLNGSSVSDELLNKTHTRLLQLLSKEDADALSYFEYTTLLGMLVFEECEYVVMEAGLGGEFDATAVFDKELSLVTPIDFDHEAFLGSNIVDIATTKLNAIQNNAILSAQKFSQVKDVATQLSKDKKLTILEVNSLLDSNDYEKIEKISKNLQLASYLRQNLHLSIGALKFFGIEYGVEDFNDARLFGRLSTIDEHVIVDVGHNPLAAASIKDALMGEKYILVYNSYKDKNYREILSILKPIIQHVEIIDVYDVRVESQEILKHTLVELDIVYKAFTGVESGLHYLVFGSFSVVEAFLKSYKKGFHE